MTMGGHSHLFWGFKRGVFNETGLLWGKLAQTLITYTF